MKIDQGGNFEGKGERERSLIINEWEEGQRSHIL